MNLGLKEVQLIYVQKNNDFWVCQMVSYVIYSKISNINSILYSLVIEFQEYAEV